MKSVCVIGAGPAGLVAAKTFLQTRNFQVTVYEKNKRIGGIWAVDRTSGGEFLSPHTPTNLSRFTVGFSDLDWNSLDLNPKETNGLQNGDANGTNLPMFPKAWMANMYLEKYRQRYIPEGIVQCDRAVVKAEPSGDGWAVTSQSAAGLVETMEFEYLIMASGFFASPRHLSQNVLHVSEGLRVNIIHSSKFRSLEDLFPAYIDVRGKKVLIIGAGNSGGETAAAVALQLSNSQWSPDTSHAERYRDCHIVHVTPRPFYPLPHFHEVAQNSRSYLPLDLKLYDFSKRPSNMSSYAGLQTREIRDVVHGIMQGMVGGDQSDLSSALVSKKTDERSPSAGVSLTDSYAEYVRSGMIDVARGRVVDVVNGQNGCASVVVDQDGEKTSLEDVASIIYATGYTPVPALDMLDNATKAAIKLDPQSMRLPMILEQWQTMSSKTPNISFLGFYEGPY